MAITTEQLKAALECRGYVVQLFPRQEGIAAVTFVIHRNAGPITSETPTLVRALPLHELAFANVNTKEMAEELLAPFGEGQRHLACARCGEPLLLKKQYISGLDLLAYGVPLEQINCGRTEQEYRSAKAGPGSPALSTCPACHSRLSKETVKEIEDS